MAARSSEPSVSIRPEPVAPATSRETDESFRLLVEQVVDYAIYHLDLDGRVASWNVGAQRIKGYAPHEILGSHFSIFFTEEDRAQARPARILARATRHGRHEEESWRVRKDGTLFPAHAVVTALRDGAGRPTGFAKIIRDLTQQLRGEENARHLVQERAARAQAERVEQERRALLRRQSDLAALRADVGALAVADGDGPELLARAALAVAQRLGVEAARIWMFDDRGDLRLQAGSGAALSDDCTPGDLRRSVVGRIAATGAPAISNDLTTDPCFGGPATPPMAFAGCPLLAVGHALGVLGVFAPGTLPDDTLDALRWVADLLGQTLERRRAISAVRRSRDQLAVIMSTISDGVTAQGQDGRLIFANEAAARICGFASAAQMLATPVQQIFERFELRDERGQLLTPADLPGRRALRGESSQMIVRVRDRASGEERWSQVSAGPVLGDSGEVALAVNVFSDLTERKRTEEAWRFLAEASVTLASSLAYETTLTAVARMAVPEIADWCIIDLLAESGQIAPLVVVHADPAKEEQGREFRRQRPRRPGDTGVVAVVASGQPLLIPQVTDPVLDGAADTAEQRAFLRALGVRSVMVVPLLAGGRPFGAITFATAESGRCYQDQDLILAREIARRASLAIESSRAYREARDAVRMRDTFLSIASHELKTPLSSLTLLLSGLLRAARDGRLTEMGPQKLIARLGRLEEQADRLAELMNQLLDVTRLAAGRFALVPAETDLTEVAREVLARFKEEAAQTDTSLTLEATGPVIGHWDRSRLDQVLTNLVTNALKYGERSPIRVVVAADEPGARLTVSDRGPGIAEADHARIFEQYERAASTNLGGLGLGLWIVRQLVQAHGGEISVVSQPGQGAAFTVLLPRRWPT